MFQTLERPFLAVCPGGSVSWDAGLSVLSLRQSRVSEVLCPPTKYIYGHVMLLSLSATKLCLIMPRATMSPTGPEASRLALALGPTSKTRTYTMGVPTRRTRDNLILPSMTTCSTPRQLGVGRRKPQLELTQKQRTFYLDS